MMHATTVNGPVARAAIDGSDGLAGLDRAARAALPPALYHYVAGASEDGAAARRNLRSFRERSFLPRVLVDVSSRTMATTLLGATYRHPFGIAPMGFSRLVADDGDLALARVAGRANIPFVLSGASLTPLEEVREAGPTSWFQAYIPGEEERIRPLVERVAAAGYDTLVITVDTAVHPKHERAARHGFRSPVRLNAALAWQGVSRPGWLWRVLLRRKLAGTRVRFENMDARRGPRVFSSTLIRDIGRRDALSWRHVEIVRRLWKDKLVIKGIMAPEDAATAHRIGVDGIIVSNHGGRQLDCAASSLDALERISRAGLPIALMVDGGIRRGSDVLKAIKLGADFVFVGRPMLMAAAIAGEEGVGEAIDLLAHEIDITMALLGLTGLSDLEGIEMVRQREFAG